MCRLFWYQGVFEWITFDIKFHLYGATLRLSSCTECLTIPRYSFELTEILIIKCKLSLTVTVVLVLVVSECDIETLAGVRRHILQNCLFTSLNLLIVISTWFDICLPLKRGGWYSSGRVVDHSTPKVLLYWLDFVWPLLLRQLKTKFWH